MSVNTCVSNAEDEDTSKIKDLMKFCLQLVHHSQWKYTRRFRCGSRVEIIQCHMIAEKFGVQHNSLDMDTMIYFTDGYAVHCSKPMPETYFGEIIRIYTDDVHTGYVRLIREKTMKEILRIQLPRYTDEYKYHGPALLTDHKKDILENKFSLSNTDIDQIISQNNSVGFADILFAVHSPYWPVEATEWITRRRPFGAPSKSIVKRVVRYGCDFVQVSHNRLNNDGEWRFSFSKAELMIVESWTISQRIVYSTLWMLNKKIARSNLCTYYFKTLMFWACEEKLTQFWSDKSFIDAVSELLIEMTKWIQSKFGMNYFIPSNNMMDHLFYIDVSNEINDLWKITQSHQLISEVVHACWEQEVLSANTTIRVEAPAWIIRAFVIFERIHNIYDNYTNLFAVDFASVYLKNALYVELSDIYTGLYFHQQCVQSENASVKHMHFLTSESHLLFAANLCKSQERHVMNNWSQQFGQISINYFMPIHIDAFSEADKKGTQLNTKDRLTTAITDLLVDHNERKCLLYSRSVKKHDQKFANNYSREKINENRNLQNININVRVLSKLNSSSIYTNTYWHYYKEWPGRSPNVNISWFIAKVYLANLYYTTHHDVSLTIRICDDIVDVSKQSSMNAAFSEMTFSVTLSTQWASIHDPEIQEIIGFYSLSSHVSGVGDRSVYLGVCPVLFALYLKLRTAFNYGFSDHVTKKFLNDYMVHIQRKYKHTGYKSGPTPEKDVCHCDERVNTGLLVVTTVIGIAARKIMKNAFEIAFEIVKNNHT